MSGMIAGKKSFFQKVQFENDYGVDIGLLIDMHQVRARIKEVCIGEVESDLQPLHVLGRMAKQVANAIFKRVNIFDGGRRQEDDPAQLMREQVEFALQGLVRQPGSVPYCSRAGARRSSRPRRRSASGSSIP